MTAPDFDVAMYKVLRYAYDCMKADAHPDKIYFTEIIQSCKEAGFLRRVDIREYGGGREVMAIAAPCWG